MKKLLLISILTPLLLCAQPSVTSRQIQDFGDSIIVTYTLQDYAQVESSYYPGAYEIILPDFASSCSPGEPSVLYKTDCFVLPYGASTSCTITDTLYEEFPIYLSPAIPVPDEDSDTIPLCPITPYSGYFPSELLDYEAPDVYRKESLQFVTISPIQYDYENQRVRKYSYIRYRIDVSLNGNVPPRQFEDDAIVANLACNYSTWKQRHAPANLPGVEANATEIHNGLLIVTTDEYRTALNEFIEWKQLKGNEVHVTTKPKGQWTTEEVEDSVRYHYNSDDNIKNLLIVGGHDDVPARMDTLNILNQSHSYTTDYYYSLPVRNFSQLHTGRIPIDTISELSIILEKIFSYERTPVRDSTFYNNCLISAYFQDDHGKYTYNPSDGYEDRSFVVSAENIALHLEEQEKCCNRLYMTDSNVFPTNWNRDYAYGARIPSYLESGNYLWDSDNLKIVSAINNGAFLTLYRGHGDETEWKNLRFGIDDLDLLTNGEKLSIVFSIACLTGKYIGNTDCLAEKFLKIPNGGCIGIFAATEQTYSQADDVYVLNLIGAIWPELKLRFDYKCFVNIEQVTSPIYKMGELRDYALSRVANYSTQTAGRQSLAKIVHYFGDPTMMIYTNFPSEFAPPAITISRDSIYVDTNVDCTISFVDATLDRHGVFRGSRAGFPFSPDLTFCLDAHNYVPYIWKANSDINIQNETISYENRLYIGKNVSLGSYVTREKTHGPVVISNSNVNIIGKSLRLDPCTIINNSNFNFAPKR